MRVKTVNLAEIATGFSGKAKVESHYKRLQRFFRDFEVDYESIALMVVKVMKIPEPWIISIDRTGWQFGKTVFNVLTLGVVHHSVAFPLVWIMLDKKGNSKTREHCELWNRFLEIFGDSKDDGQKELRTDVCFQDLQVGESKVLSKPRKVWNHWLRIATMRLKDDDLLIVATAHAPNTAISNYAKRWAIETLFGCFKTRGFCLESTHLQDSQRLSKLIALLTRALCWAFSSGLWLAQLIPLKPKKHGRLPKSIFRLGFDFLRPIIFDLHLNSEAFFNSLNFLSCT